MKESGDKQNFLVRLFSRRKSEDKELEEFRQIMQPPGTFEEGFSWTAFAGALFVAVIMVPGSIYMSLLAGTTVGPAARWVTLILFIEVARRANRRLKNAELFILFLLTSAIMAEMSAAHGNFQGGLRLLWAQFYAQSDAAVASGIADKIPGWFAPTDPSVLEQRSIFRMEWLPAIGLIIFTSIIGRIDNVVVGYGLFRATSDIERLPFPMAPVRAQGIIALSEEQEEESRDASLEEEEEEEREDASKWRWRVFSTGGMFGLAFGAVYMGLPTVTGALLPEPLTVFPIPFVDFTPEFAQHFNLKAVAVGFTFDMGVVILGMVLPFFAVVGSFIGLMITFILNPILYNMNILQSWDPSDTLQSTFFKNQVDFYFSFSIGVAVAIALVGFIQVGHNIIQSRRQRRAGTLPSDRDSSTPPEGRGDIRIPVVITVYVITAMLYIYVSMMLIGWEKANMGVFYVMIFYAFLYVPLISYVSARMEGLAGKVVNIPFAREAMFILSGYRGAAVWFLPIPIHNYGMQTVMYRQAELTGTKFRSIWKSELFLTPLLIFGGLFFANFIWSIAPVPSAVFPYAQEWWQVIASNKSLIFSSTLGRYSQFEEALNFQYILSGTGIGLVSFAVLTWLGAPIFLMYGVVRGLNQTLPFVVIPEFIGALIGRYYMRRKLGPKWRKYAPVVLAGFGCGMGLTAVVGIGFTFLFKSVFQLPF